MILVFTKNHLLLKQYFNYIFLTEPFTDIFLKTFFIRKQLFVFQEKTFPKKNLQVLLIITYLVLIIFNIINPRMFLFKVKNFIFRPTVGIFPLQNTHHSKTNWEPKLKYIVSKLNRMKQNNFQNFHSSFWALKICAFSF